MKIFSVFFSNLISLLLKYLSGRSAKNELKQKHRIDLLSNAYRWLSDSESPCTGPLHFLNKKIHSVLFNSIEFIFTKKEKKLIYTLHDRARANSDRILSDNMYTSDCFRQDTVPIAQDFLSIVTLALNRQRKKWKIV